MEFLVGQLIFPLDSLLNRNISFVLGLNEIFDYTALYSAHEKYYAIWAISLELQRFIREF